jgi:hypothetical protein
MPDVQRLKTDEVVRVLLQRARLALPATQIDYEKAHQSILSRYHESMGQDNPREALNALEELGSIVRCRGGFWRDLERVAVTLGLSEKLPGLRAHFTDTVNEQSKTR